MTDKPNGSIPYILCIHRITRPSMSGATLSTSKKIDKHVFLMGRPPMSEFLGVVSSQVNYDASHIAQLADDWRLASNHILKLQKDQASAPDKPAYKDVPANLKLLAEQALTDEIFQRSFNVVKPVVRMVELDSLVVSQKHINLNYVEELKKQLGKTPSDEDIFKTCIPIEHPMPEISASRVSSNSFVFVSQSADLRVLDSTLLRPNQIKNYTTSGPMATVLGMAVGTGSNCLNSMFVNGRMILNNGSHRAYALRSMGITYAPCIVQQVTCKDELDIVATAEFLQNPAEFIEAPRPAMLKDYFDLELIKILPVQRKRRQIKISYTIETIDVPDI